MTDRSVLVRLRADVSGYVSGIQAAALQTKDFSLATLAAAESHQRSWDKIGKASLIAGGAVAVGIGEAIKAAAEFDHTMSTVKANIDDKTAPSMARLSQAAMEAGKATMFSATAAAEAENQLAKVGITSAQITGGALTGVLALAAATEIDLPTAAGIAAAAMNQFHLAAKDIPHVADLLAAGADRALGGVVPLSEALKFAGVVSSQFGINIDTTVGVLTMFAQNGILGTMAGTGFRMMLVQMAKPTAEATDLMKKYNITAFDTRGQFVGMATLAGELHTQLGGLTQQEREHALVVLFGTRALAEANILYAQGAAGVKEWTAKVNEQGFAAMQASTKLNNLAGDLTILRTSLNVALIEGGQGAQGPLRVLTQNLTGVVNGFADLPEPAKQAMLAVGAVSAAALLLGGTAVLATTRIAAMKVSLETMGMEGGRATAMMRGFGVATLAAAVAVPVLGQAANSISASLGEVAPGTTEASRALLEFANTGKATGDSADLINLHFADLGNTVNNVLSSGLGHKVSAFFSQISPGNLSGFEKSETNLSIEFFKTLDSGLSNMATSGHAQQATILFKRVTDEAAKQHYTIAQVAAAFPQYAAAVTAGNTGVAKSVEDIARQTSKMSELSVTLGGAADATGSAMRILGAGADAASDAVKNLAKVIQGDMDSAAKAFAADMDVLGAYDPKKQADAVASAADTLKKAQEAATTAAGASGTKGKPTPAQLRAALKADSNVRDAQDAYDKAKRDQAAASLTSSYATQIKAGKQFADNIDAVTRAGLDPQVIARLLQEGPTKAAPALAALLGNHSKQMIGMVNASEKSLAAINARVVEQARLTSMAVNAQNDQMTGDLAKAMGIASAKAKGGGKATIESIAASMKLSVPEVTRIAGEFGIGILSGVKTGTVPATAAIDGIRSKLQAIANQDWTITVNVVPSFAKGLQGYPGKAADNAPGAPNPLGPFAPATPFTPRPTTTTPTRAGTTTTTTTTHQPVNIFGPVVTPSHSDLLTQVANKRRAMALGSQ